MATGDVLEFKTPQEFIEYHSTQLKANLNKFDIQINKLGLVGYLFNILGWTNYDTKQYYDNLFKEAFVATAQSDENLYLHSSIYGYYPLYATPSVATGTFTFDFSSMPSYPGTVFKREVIFENISFTIGSYIFTTECTYHFIQDNNNYYGMIYDEAGGVQYVSSSSSSITVPFKNVKQIDIQELSVYIQKYNFGTYYSYQFELDSEDGYLADIDVKIKTRSLLDDTEWTSFDVAPVKYFQDAFTDVVFLRNLSSTKFLMEFGSGTRGSYVPNSDAKITLHVTKGKSGNLNVSSTPKLSSGVTSTVKYYYTSDPDSPESISGIETTSILTGTFDYSTDGSDPLDGELLRSSLVKYIQSRDNLLTEKDYNNIASNYLSDFKILFRKGNITDNIFYLLRAFRDKNQIPIKSTNYTQPTIDFTTIPTISPTLSLINGGSLVTGTHSYMIGLSDGFNENIYGPFDIDVIIGDQTVNISLPIISNLNKYNIYSRGLKWTIPSSVTTFIDDGSNTGSEEYVPVTSEYVISDQPTFLINNQEFISPFLYRYDSFMDWYKGFILYDNLITYIDTITTKTDTETVPNFYFNIVYNRINHKTIINVKSHQDISTYQIYLTVHDLNINKELLTPVDENTWKFEYTYDIGIIWEKSINLEITVLNSSGTSVLTASSSNVTQIYDITDQLKLLIYRDEDDQKYITNIPIMNKEVYTGDSTYYLNNIYNFIVGNSFSENRLINDDIQFRFLNSNLVSRDYMKYSLVQEYNSIDIQLPLKLEINCCLDQIYLKNNPDINISTEKENILLEVAEVLQSLYTGVDIQYYNSQLVDIVHSGRIWIKSVDIIVKDSSGAIVPDGIDTYSLTTTLNNIRDDLYDFEKNPDGILSKDMKIKLLTYTPPFWYWDVNNLELNITY